MRRIHTDMFPHFLKINRHNAEHCRLINFFEKSSEMNKAAVGTFEASGFEISGAGFDALAVVVSESAIGSEIKS